jgi:hypothetical protein
MHVATHLLASWDAAAGSGLRGRDLALVTWAGVAPDLDGIGLVVDTLARWFGGETEFYAWHHVYGHGLPAALLIAAIFGGAGERKLRTGLGAFLMVHLHLLCDLVGSRGLRPEDVWEISYLSPFSDALRVTWGGQWPVSSWQNTVITAVLLVVAVAIAVRRRVSPVALVSARADGPVVAALVTRWTALRPRRRTTAGAE